MNSLYDYSLVDLLPSSLTKDPFIVALAEAVEIELKEAYREAEEMAFLYDVDKLPEILLDYLAHQKHADFYENTLSIDQKRKLIKGATAWHRKKGTPWAVEQVVSIIFENAQVTEWYEYEGDPYFFRIETESTLQDSKDFNRLLKLVDATKNKRSWLDSVKIKRTNDAHIYAGGYISEWNSITIDPAEFKIPTLKNEQFVAGFISTWSKSTISMKNNPGVKYKWLITRGLF